MTVEPQGAAKLVSPAKGPLSERCVAACGTCASSAWPQIVM